MKKTEFIKKFTEILEEHGDTFFSSGKVGDDYDTIVGTLMVQGYWSGNRLRYYFDSGFNLTSVEERVFGNGANVN